MFLACKGLFLDIVNVELRVDGKLQQGVVRSSVDDSSLSWDSWAGGSFCLGGNKRGAQSTVI